MENMIRLEKIKKMNKYEKYKITDFNTYLFHQGRNFQSYNILGSKIIQIHGMKGVRFTLWAPHAVDVYIIGDFNKFSIDENYKMEKITTSGLWSIFIFGIEEGSKYKYAIKNKREEFIYKSDPYSIYSEVRPNSASIIYKPKKFLWEDSYWLKKRELTNIYESPVNIYELHIGSWKRKNGEFLTYRELKEILPKYIKDMNYTHVEFLPLTEHPLDASWGYQSVGFYSLTSRYGNIEDFKELVNELHKNNIGVILDWSPGHFCKDGHGLYRFDGEETYEYKEEWKGENKGWGTANFDLGKGEVRSFLISNAIYWIKEFHIDGLRVDAVSNILYLNYGREDGEWVPNIYGESGNLEGIEFIKELNDEIDKEFKNVIIIAEESTSWPNVCKSNENKGLGFDFKWNMGWMNDILEYVSMDPIYRKYHHNNLNFSMMYNYSENFILPISHDEVVCGKKSLIDKMWGDYLTKFAGVRVFYMYMMGHPGKKLLFMGCEFGQFIEWREYEELEWYLVDKFLMHKRLKSFFRDLNYIYINNKALWQLDYEREGFKWIDADNRDQSIISFIRKGKKDEDILVFILNFTPVSYKDFRVGVPYKGVYEEILNSDSKKYGGEDNTNSKIIFSEEEKFHNFENSIKVNIPSMGGIILKIINKEGII